MSNHPPATSAGSIRIARRAFTLIEMALSLSLVGIVLISLSTMLALTMEAAPRPDDPATVTRDVSFPVDLMAEELSSAISIISVSPHAIRFRIADRDGDDLPDTIAYEWSGKEGSPMTRTVNAEKPVEIISSVFDADFSAPTESHELTTTMADIGTNFEHELSTSTSVLGGILTMLNSRLETLNTGEGYFQVLPISSVPADALFWVPEYVEVPLESNNGSGRVRLELRIEDNLSPTNTAVASKVIKTSDFGSESWVRLPVGGNLRLPPETKLGVMVVSISGNRAVKTRIFQQFLFPHNPASRYTNNSGSTWSASVTTRLGFRVRGQYFRQAKQETTSQTTVSSVRFRINPSPAASTSISTMVDLPAPVRYGP